MTARRRGAGALLVIVVAVGVGLAAAPAAFGMFGRAPAGGQMIEDFVPHMRTEALSDFRRDLALIGTAHDEVAALSTSAADAPSSAAFTEAWPRIDRDMTAMLTTIEANVSRFEGLRALPPFWAFSWFFVLPGVIMAGLAILALRRPSAGRRGLLAALAVLAVGVIAAPAVFQMFTRAPGGAAMIDDFRPLMTEANIAGIQQSFLVIAAAEGELRTEVLGSTPVGLPAVQEFVQQWPRIAGEMAPMIGAMADNLDNFAAVDALPPFWLFPWFFVFPGLIVLSSALGALPVRVPEVTPVRAAAPTLEGSSS